MSESTTPEPTPLKCFVIMPFTETAHAKGKAKIKIVADQWGHIFEQWIRKAVESFSDRQIICKRSTATPGNFVKGIVEDLNDSHLVVADLTGNRPNVYYELGIRNALRTGTVMITQDFKALPSDLLSYYCFAYDYTEKAHEYGEHFSRFEREMHEKLRKIISNNFPSDNPVSDFLGFNHYFQSHAFNKAQRQMSFLLHVWYQALYHSVEAMVEFSECATRAMRLSSPIQAKMWGHRDRIDIMFGRIMFDVDSSLFPEQWLERMRSAIDRSQRIIVSFLSCVQRYIDTDDATDWAPVKDAILALSLSLSELPIKQLRAELLQFKEPASR